MGTISQKTVIKQKSNLSLHEEVVSQSLTRGLVDWRKGFTQDISDRSQELVSVQNGMSLSQ